MRKRMLSMLLALCLVLSLLPAQVFAQEEPAVEEAIPAEMPAPEAPAEEPVPEMTEEVSTPVTEEAPETTEAAAETAPEADVAFSHAVSARWVNPLCTDMTTQAPETPVQRPRKRAPSGYVTLERASEILQTDLRYRRDMEDIHTYAPNDPSMSDEEFELYLNLLWEAVLLDAMAHTGDPNLGDYLAIHLASASGGISYDDSDPDTVYLQFVYSFEYFTDTSQESLVANGVDAFIKEFRTSNNLNATAYEKVEAIYTFLTENVKFDQAGLNNASDTLKNTAYGAMVEKSAVGPGFAALFYYMALKMEVDARIVVDENGHAWNIVAINGMYYHVDAAWDAKRVQAGQEWKYFLKCNQTMMADHTIPDIFLAPEFQEIYPPAKADYDGAYLTQGSYGTVSWTLTADGLLRVEGSGAIPSYQTLYELPIGWPHYTHLITAIEIGEGITEIGESVFQWCDAVTVSLPSTLRVIGSRAFEGCKSLTQIRIPASVKEIGEYAFGQTSKLESIEFDPRNANQSLKLDTYALGMCLALKEITLPDNVTVGDAAFYHCSAMKTIHFGKNTTLDARVFLYCTGLETVALPEGLKAVDNALFLECTSLKTVIFPEGFERIGTNMFVTCPSLEELTLPASVKQIGSEAFLECPKLKKIVFEGNCPDIDPQAFYTVTATAHYPLNKSGWTTAKLVDYGGKITWEPYRIEGAKFDIAFANMTLGNSLAMNFAFPQLGAENWEGAYAQIAKTYADGRGTKLITVPISQWGEATISGQKYYTIKFNGIAAKEMADEIYITIYNGQRKPISNNWEDSVRSYAMRTLNNPSTAPESLTMIVDLLNYGAAAQLSFGYDTGNLANSKLTAQQAAMATPSADAEDGRIKGENYLGTQLRLESQILLRMAFSNVTADMTAQVSFTDHYRRAQTYTIEGSKFEITGSTAVVMIDQIVVADARGDVTVQITDSEGNVVASATDSVAGYIARMRQEEEDPLYEAILKFADSAYRYFHPGSDRPSDAEHSELYIEGLSQSQVVQYFNEVCFGDEASGGVPYIRKWTQPICYRISGDIFESDFVILEAFVAQLNELEGFPGMHMEDGFAESNFTITFTNSGGIADISGDWSDYWIDDSVYKGAVALEHNENDGIFSGRLGVLKSMDQTSRTSELKEQLYKGLGPMTETVQRRDSIIYSEDSMVTELSQIDWLILKLLYSEAIRPGMDKNECEKVLRNLYW